MGKKDIASKSATTLDPRGVLHLLGRLDISEPAEVTAPGTEMVLNPTLTDRVLTVRRRGSASVEILETLAYWDRREIPVIAHRAWMAGLMKEFEGMPITVTISILSPARCPRSLPREFTLGRGGVSYSVRPVLVKAWLLDPAEVEQLGRVTLYPWLAVMERTTWKQMETAAAALAPFPELAALFSIFGEVRYGEERIHELLRRFEMTFPSPETIAKLPVGRDVYRMGLEAGKTEGLERGLEQGREQGILESIRCYVEARFPALTPAIDLSWITDPGRASKILQALYSAPDESAARKVLAPRKRSSRATS